MKKVLFFFLISLVTLSTEPAAASGRITIDLNGTWQFDQTLTAFPPATFTRTIPVPGLIHLATPKIEEYDRFFKKSGKTEAKEQHNLYHQDYTPRYSWYRRTVFIPRELAFCYLTNNYGYTGDWFLGDIRDLRPSPTLDWFRHAFAPAATFINLTDERYTRFVKAHAPGSQLLFNLAGVHNLNKPVGGNVWIRLIDAAGKVSAEQQLPVRLEPFLRTDIPVSLTLPSVPGGYVLIAAFTPANGTPLTSRRFLKIGQPEKYSYFSVDPLNP